MRKKFTGWFDWREKPARKGVYQRMFPSSGKVCFSNWDGKKWCFSADNAKNASRISFKSNNPYLPWRGLAKESKK